MDQLPSTVAAALADAAEFLKPASIFSAMKEFWDFVGPGGRLHPAYFLEHKGHLVVEGLLIVLILVLFAQGRFKPKAHSEDPLTEKEVDQLCKEWYPEPLVPSIPPGREPPVIDRIDGQFVVINNKRVLNFASGDFLGLAGNPDVVDQCSKAIDKYGVGSCGPRGFYGTVDVHLQLEQQLARFFHHADAILYSYDIATSSSVVPTLVNRKDIVIVDECVSYPIQQGCRLSKAKVVRFKHNDMEDLERVLKKTNEDERRTRKPLNRRYIIVEAVYANYGDLAKLDDIIRLKNKYCWRLMVEESYSVGVLGATGRGACEHWGVQPNEVDALVASMGTSLGTVGGFCLGSKEIVDHQRLAGQAYVFSASLPPYSAVAAITALHKMEQGGDVMVKQLAARSKALRKELSSVPGLELHGTPEDSPSPLLHLRLPSDFQGKQEDGGAAVLQRIVDRVLERDNILLGMLLTSSLDNVPCLPSIKVLATTQLTDADIATLGRGLRAAVADVLSRR